MAWICVLENKDLGVASTCCFLLKCATANIFLDADGEVCNYLSVFDSICPGKLIATVHWVGPMLLNPVEIARVPEGICGVYLLHHFDAALGGYPIFYVGKAENIRRRLTQHIHPLSAKSRISSARRLSQTYFSAAPVPRVYLARVEASLIDALRPVCNDLIPCAEPLVVNLPPLFL